MKVILSHCNSTALTSCSETILLAFALDFIKRHKSFLLPHISSKHWCQRSFATLQGVRCTFPCHLRQSGFSAIFLIKLNHVIFFPFQSSEDLIEEKQRSVNLEELKDWKLKNIVKMSGPAGKVVPSSMVNLPLRFGRNFLEKRNIKPAANLPLRFGRAFRYFSDSYEKAPSVQSFLHSLANLPEKFGRSILFSLIQGTQDCDQIKNR